MFTSTTAPGKHFASRTELQEHYKSEWHRYNLKRRQGGLPLLNQADFQARWEAALALRQERATMTEKSGTDHLKKKNKQESDKKKKNKVVKRNDDDDDDDNRVEQPRQQQGNGESINNNNNNNLGFVAVSQVPSYHNQRQQQQQQQPQQLPGEEKIAEDTNPVTLVEADAAAANEIAHNDDNEDNDNDDDETEPVEIEPKQSLFDRHVSSTVAANINRMHRKFGFFIPDTEYLVDLEGLIGYCHEKIKLGHACLYCQRVFRTWQSCQRHMISTRHTKLRYERGIDLEEFDPFYDFSEANAEFYQRAPQRTEIKKEAASASDTDDNANEKGEEEEWEDIPDEEKDDNDNDDDDDVERVDDLYAGYEDEIAKYGFDVTPLGELIFPDGRIVGHRGLARYYKQRLFRREDGAAVLAARRAAGERLHGGRVYSLYHDNSNNNNSHNINASSSSSHALALRQAGMAPGTAHGHVSGKGILVASSQGGYTALSLYRYRAVVRKEQKQTAQGQRLRDKTFMNMNRMDKKANRLMNNVSVAHAQR